MKLWLTLCLGGLAVTAVLLLPPASADFVRGDAWQLAPATQQAKRLDTRAILLDWKIRLLRTQDSLEAHLGAAPRQGRTALVSFPTEIAGTEGASEFEAAAAAQLDNASSGGPDPTPVVAVIFLETRWGSELGIPGHQADHTFAGTLANGTPYCARVAWSTSARSLYTYADSDGGGPLGLCRLWARFGPPGPHVETWLRAGGHEFVRAAQRSPWWLAGARPPFGLGAMDYLANPMSRNMIVHASDCVHDDPERCAASILEPGGAAARDDVMAVTDLVTGVRVRSATFIDRYFLAELEAREDVATVRTFWTSDRPVPAAFREATGTEIGVWMGDWFDSAGMAFVDGAGPGVGARDAGLSLLTLVGFFGLALRLHSRRQVG